jgi:acetolactate synthase I/II/III large subunit
MRLADYVMSFVAQQGVKHVFLVTGGGAMHLNDALARCDDLTFICNHHEQASAIAAENYSKATNNLGVALVTTGPGGTNAISGVVGAWLDSTPMLVLSGQVKRADRMYRSDGTPLGVRQRGIQEVDIVTIAQPFTKYAVTIDDPESIRFHLEKAVYLAKSGRPGPVWIDIPVDVQASPIQPDSLVGFREDRSISTAVELSEQVHKVIQLLNSANRPLILAGNGVRLAGAQEDLLKLASRLNVPIETTWLALDLISEEHPLFVGRPGTVAPRGPNFALQNCDLLLTVGARMDITVVGYSPTHLARGAHKVMVDIDAAEIDKFGPVVELGIRADAGHFLRELMARADSVAVKDRSQWLRRCADWKERYPVVLPEHRAPGRVSIYHLSEVVSELVPSDEYIVSGSSGSGIEIFLLAYKSRQGRKVFHTTALGAMGFAIPASVGVAIAGGHRRTICIDGDGGFQLNIQELATIARHNLPIKFFILNNGGYASIRASQTAFFGAPAIGCDDRTGIHLPDFCKVASAYGLKTAVIAEQSGLRAAVKQVIETEGPVVCEVQVVPDEVRGPRVSSVQRSDGSFVSKPLEDLWPFLSREEFLSNMMVPPLDGWREL